MTIKTTLALAAVAVSLAGCAAGTARYTALPETGELTPTRLKMAQAACQMRWKDQVDTAMNSHALPDIGGMVEDGKNCYLTQGIQVTWVQKDGTETSSPWAKR